MLIDQILIWIGENPAEFADRDKSVVIFVWVFYQLPPFFAIGFAAYPWIKLWLQYKKKRQKVTKQQLIKAIIFSIILGYVGYWMPPYLLEFIGGIGVRSL